MRLNPNGKTPYQREDPPFAYKEPIWFPATHARWYWDTVAVASIYPLLNINHVLLCHTVVLPYPPAFFAEQLLTALPISEARLHTLPLASRIW